MASRETGSRWRVLPLPMHAPGLGSKELHQAARRFSPHSWGLLAAVGAQVGRRAGGEQGEVAVVAQMQLPVAWVQLSIGWKLYLYHSQRAGDKENGQQHRCSSQLLGPHTTDVPSNPTASIRLELGCSSPWLVNGCQLLY